MMTLQNDDFFWFAVSSWGTHLPSFLTFPICFKCRMTIKWSSLSSLATSHVVLRGSALMIALSWSLPTSNGQALCSSSSRLSSPLQNFLNHHCIVHSSSVPWLHKLVMLQVFSSAWWHILNSNKKITQICFFVKHQFHSLKYM